MWAADPTAPPSCLPRPPPPHRPPCHSVTVPAHRMNPHDTGYLCLRQVPQAEQLTFIAIAMAGASSSSAGPP
eukprot:37886-Eustigmatos_ZCMA.PRE.1